jgi:anti-sigma factor RsiW
MCPDPQLLSTYIDGELPSPWKEKMEKHLAKCSSCSDKLDNLKRLQQLFKKSTHQERVIVERAAEDNADGFTEHEFLEAAKNRVWNNLLSKGRRRRSDTVWRRRLSIPLPVAAAAAVIAAVITVVLVRGGFANQQPEQALRSNFILAAEDEIPAFPAMDMNTVLQYLNTDGGEILIIQLPESRSFLRTGEPAMIRAADYSRRHR